MKTPKQPKKAREAKQPKSAKTHKTRPVEEPVAYSDEELQSFFNQDLWLSSTGKLVPLKDMHDYHILNAVERINKEGPDSYNGFGFQWLPKLIAEIQRRSDEDPADDERVL